MLKRVIDGWNASPYALAAGDPGGQGGRELLPIRAYPAEALLPNRIYDLQYVESAWEPTPAELDAIARGHSIILRVVGWQPPVLLYVDAAPSRHEVTEGASWVLRYAAFHRMPDEVFCGLGAEDRARSRFEMQRLILQCSLFREVTRA